MSLFMAGLLGRAAGATATTTRHSEMRGSGRMTVLRRELPRTRFASWDRIVASRVLQRAAPAAGPQQVGVG